MSIKFCAVGDIMLGENFHHFGRGIRTVFRHNPNALIADSIKKKLFVNDYFLFNCEFSIVDNTYQFENIETSAYRVESKFLDIFPKNTKIIANIANNHFSQHGAQAAEFTKQVMRKKNILIIGENKQSLKIHTAKETLHIWGASIIEDKKYCSKYWLPTLDELFSYFYYKNKKDGEIWILSIHWGDEYVKSQSLLQSNIADRLTCYGIDLIIGHHPHVIQPNVIMNGKRVFYSLGNFIFDQNFMRSTQEGLGLNFSINNKLEILNIYLIKSNKFRADKIHSFDQTKYFSRSILGYPITVFYRKILARLMMKIELFYNIQKVDKQVLNYFFRKLKVKINFANNFIFYKNN